MEYRMIAIILGALLIILKFIFGANGKEIKKFQKDEVLDKAVEKLPNNMELAKNLFSKINNESVTIKQWEIKD